MFRQYRSLFPVTSGKIYMNHAAISPLSTRVTDKLEEYIDERSFGLIDNFHPANEARNRTRIKIAQLINANARQIAFIQNTSEGFNHLVNGLQWQAGDEIIVPDCEFPSNVYPFLNLEKRFGVKIKYIPSREGIIHLDDIASAISSKTRMLTISFVEFSNGFRNDLERIGALCKEKDIIFSVDGIQGIGAIPIDVQKSNISFISNGGHKWLMGLMGAAFIYISDELFEQLEPSFTGWLAVQNAWDFSKYELDLIEDARRYEYATANLMGISALSESVGLLMEVGIPNIQKHLTEIGRQMIQGFAEAGMKFTGSADENHWSGIFSFSGNKTSELYEYLTKGNIVVSLRNGMIRVAPHFYNTSEEIDELVSVIKKFYRTVV